MDISMNSVAVIEDICVGGLLPNREKLLELEQIMLKMPQVEIPVKHYTHGSMYAREILIPKDTILTGKIHKFDHFDVMISGDITVSSDTEETIRMTGYNIFNGVPGKKRGGYAHEDTLWITFHYYPFTDLDEENIERFLTAESFQELEMFNKIKAVYLEKGL